MRSLFLLLTPVAVLTAWPADLNKPVVVSAASPQVGVAPDSLATVYGPQLTTVTEAAGNPPWPTSLGDMPVVWVTDATSTARMASLIFVSPGQMNIYIPAGTAPGPATVSFPFTGLPIGVGTAALRIVPVDIRKVAPGLFTAGGDGAGTGVVAATAVRVMLPTWQQTPVPVFMCDKPASCTPIPIDVGIDAPVYLSLYGTGIRGASSPAAVKVTIGGRTLEPLYAGAQPTIPGLDQINVGLPLDLRGAGLVNVFVTVDGVDSNWGQIRIQ